MEREGLVLALIAVHEAQCHRHHVSCCFIMSSLSLCLCVALSLCPCSVFLLLLHCGGMSSLLRVVGTLLWCVLVSRSPGRCPALCHLVCAHSII